MAQVSGAIVVDLDLDRLADLLADRIAARLRDRPAGSEVYERDPGPAASDAPTRGTARYGGVVDDAWTVERE
jgi:hypothetical protein